MLLQKQAAKCAGRHLSARPVGELLHFGLQIIRHRWAHLSGLGSV
jgi:hypothetical protein